MNGERLRWRHVEDEPRIERIRALEAALAEADKRYLLMRDKASAAEAEVKRLKVRAEELENDLKGYSGQMSVGGPDHDSWPCVTGTCPGKEGWVCLCKCHDKLQAEVEQLEDKEELRASLLSEKLAEKYAAAESRSRIFASCPGCKIRLIIKPWLREVSIHEVSY